MNRVTHLFSFFFFVTLVSFPTTLFFLWSFLCPRLLFPFSFSLLRPLSLSVTVAPSHTLSLLLSRCHSCSHFFPRHPYFTSICSLQLSSFVLPSTTFEVITDTPSNLHASFFLPHFPCLCILTLSSPVVFVLGTLLADCGAYLGRRSGSCSLKSNRTCF